MEEQSTKLSQQIDAMLPQTQCGQCGYTGCLPYAKAIVEHGVAIDRCLPGGIKTLKAIAQLANRDITALLANHPAQEQSASIAKIRANECIGCTKCLQACPVDAIIGSAKQLHVVLTSECTGCDLCIAPCPVDCIDKVPLPQALYQPERARQRFQARQQRLQKIHQEKLTSQHESTVTQQRAYIQAVVARVQHKRNLMSPPSANHSKDKV